MGKDGENVGAAEQDIRTYEQQLADLKESTRSEIQALIDSVDVNRISIQTVSIRPRKTDITAEPLAVLWWPL
jgi:hypothetical protein